MLRVVRLLEPLTSSQPDVLIFPGEPRSKARPRFNGSRVAYNSAEQKTHEAALSWRFRQAVKQPYDGNVALACIFFRSSRHRIDLDNCVKQICDAANKIVFHDDYQVTATVAVLDLDAEAPRTVVAIASHDSSGLARDRLYARCAVCGKRFGYYPTPTFPTRTHCSRVCAMKRHRVKSLARCAHCGQDFFRKYAAQALCSEDCRRSDLGRRGRNRRKLPVRHCACGQALSRPEYVRCRSCWRAETAAKDPDRLTACRACGAALTRSSQRQFCSRGCFSRWRHRHERLEASVVAIK